MVFDYLLVHLKFTIPQALFLTVVAYPILTRTHVYQILCMITIAFCATLPWDSTLIKLGTYLTSLIFIIFNKPLLHVQHLVSRKGTTLLSVAVFALLVCGALAGLGLYIKGGHFTYLGILLVWALPFAALAFFFSGEFILTVPLISILGPILIPTFYLWVVDGLALERGTWAIAPATKLGIQVWASLDLEEAVFFLMTNVLIVFGLAGSSHAIAIAQAYPDVFPTLPPRLTVEKMRMFLPWAKYGSRRISGIQQAVKRLKRKSRSFYLASSAFAGRLRVDLILLYSYCRVADDLVDDAGSGDEASQWINRLDHFLDLSYGDASPLATTEDVGTYVRNNFPLSAQPALLLLPVAALPSAPLYALLDGFKMDLSFHKDNIQNGQRNFPIVDERALERYAECVAGTVGQLCVALIAYHCNKGKPLEHGDELLEAARQMGIALQYVNIARDIATDAAMGRVYLPTTWLEQEGLTPELVLKQPTGGVIAKLRSQLLARAFAIYEGSRPTMRWLPREARGPMIAAVENYMEIGRVLREMQTAAVPIPGRATVPVGRRLRVALRALLSA